MRDTLGALFPLLGLVLPLFALQIYFIWDTYKEHIDALTTHEHAIKIQPKRSRFIFSLSIYYLAVAVLMFAVFCFLPLNKGKLIFFLVYLLLSWVINLFLSYPRYTLIIDDAKLSGAALWDWSRSRVAINLHEIDKQKVVQQNLGKSLGIVVIQSAKGTKILTLGLDHLQIQEILDNAGVHPR